MKVDALRFPLEPEAFLAYQEAGLGRKIPESERGLIEAWVHLFNLSYEDGRRQDLDALKKDFAKLGEQIAAREDRPALVQFLETTRCWVVYAWKRGEQERGGAQS